MNCCVNANAGRTGRKPQLRNVNGSEDHDTAVDGSDSTVLASSSSVSSQDQLEEYPLGLLEEAIARRYEHMGNTGDARKTLHDADEVVADTDTVDADVDNVDYAVLKILTNFAVFR